jgi:hypothetical protein
MSQSVLEQTFLTPQVLCRGLELPYRSYCRWTRRQQQGLPLLLPSGPPKLGPLPMDALLEDLDRLVPRAKRTRGTGSLCQHWQPFIGRRPLQTVVHQRRRQTLRARRRKLRRIRWLHPDVAWAIDATQCSPDSHGHALDYVIVQDLATTYQFDPLLAMNLRASAAAQYLEELFRQHPPPLFLKRDNGSVFNTPEVDALLNRCGVIPLNSPARYPRYNGAIEHGIGELKRDLRATCRNDGLPVPGDAAWFLRWFIQRHNSRRRRLLAGQSALEAHTLRCRPHWTLRQRHAIFAWIGARAKRILRAVDHPNQHDRRRAWRRSVESWLRCQRLIEVANNQQPVTPFDL